MYRTRRKAFMERIGKGGVGLFRSAAQVPRRKFRQDSNFYYLTGFDEPDSICLIAPDQPEHHFILFVQSKDESVERWTGMRAGVEGAVEKYGADIAYPVAAFDEHIHKYLEHAERIYYSFGSDPEFDRKVFLLTQNYAGKVRLLTDQGPNIIIDPREILNEMRAIKSEAELELIERAAVITAEAHIAAMKAMKPGLYEYEIEALIDYIFRKNGALMPAYETIVGAGANSAIIHYRTNGAVIQDGDMALIDAGAEYNYYGSDVTRTIPANGRFSKAQQEVYEIVLEAQMAAIAAIQPGATYFDPISASRRVITEGLVRLGILEGDMETLIQEKKYAKYTTQAAPHWLGMDNHDAGKYRYRNGDYAILQPNAVITVEPGLYFSSDMLEVPEPYRKIGVRIEDVIVVTPDGRRNLTAEIPKTIAEIERTMKKRLILSF